MRLLKRKKSFSWESWIDENWYRSIVNITYWTKPICEMKICEENTAKVEKQKNEGIPVFHSFQDLLHISCQSDQARNCHSTYKIIILMVFLIQFNWSFSRLFPMSERATFFPSVTIMKTQVIFQGYQESSIFFPHLFFFPLKNRCPFFCLTFLFENDETA